MLGAMNDPVEAAFAPGGPLAGAVVNYAPREEQVTMARAVRDAMADRRHLVVEAGTGTGKTFAYLVPALLSGRRVAVSTGTRALQEQLFGRDLPTLARALGLPVRIAMLKGRANYLCHQRLELTAGREGADADHLARIRDWARGTRAGDIAEVEGVPEDASVWGRVTSTADNCLGSRCPAYADCCVAKARRTAAGADLVIVNHHLLLADLALRDGGFGELLPHTDVVIVDEAHQLPAIAAQQFGRSLSFGQLQGWHRDIVGEAVALGLHASVSGALAELERLTLAARAVLLADGPRRVAWPQVAAAGGAPLAAVAAAVDEFATALDGLGEGSAALDQLARRGTAIATFLRDFLAADADAGAGPAGAGQGAGGEGVGEEGAVLRWLDAHRHSFSLYLTPLESAAALGAAIGERSRAASWIFTSATLAVEDDFTHFMARVGLGDALTLKLDSPFDYARNALLYLPAGMPDPAHPDFVRAVCEAALPLIQANAGGTFLLFTSYRALQAARRWLDGRLDRLLLAQGDAPRSVQLERFRADGRAVLLGTASFWEGVDVRGPALSLVVIDKLPFASPQEPLLRARLDWIEQQGGNGFRDHQLPAAVIALKQGVGRLIRDHDDRGVLMICDPRLTGRGYGKRFLRSLPPMRRVGEAAQAAAFLRDAPDVVAEDARPAWAAGAGQAEP